MPRLLNALYGDGSAKLLGLGVLAVIVGVITLLPVAARPLASAIGWPLRLRGVPGDLARQNAMRNPRRTASTATALMIGLTLVVSMGVFAASLKASFSGLLEELDDRRPVPPPARAAGARASAPRRPRPSQGFPASGSPPAIGARPGSTVPTRRTTRCDPATATETLDLRLSSGLAGRTWAPTASWWRRRPPRRRT